MNQYIFHYFTNKREYINFYIHAMDLFGDQPLLSIPDTTTSVYDIGCQISQPECTTVQGYIIISA